MNGVQVCPAVAGDAGVITEVYLASWRAAYQGLLPPDVLAEQAAERAKHDWVARIQDQAHHVAVAVDAGAVVGVVEAAQPPGGSRDLPEIVMLYVHPEHWGAGTATALLADGVSWMTAHRWPVARLRVVEAHTRARRFYEREGWVLDDDLEPDHNGMFRLLYYRRSLAC